MKDPQREVEELRAGVNGATVLEKATRQWLLDRKGSSKRCLKLPPRAGRDRHRHARSTRESTGLAGAPLKGEKSGRLEPGEEGEVVGDE